jgi:histone H3/H4
MEPEDYEEDDYEGASHDELSLPKATVGKIIQEMLPQNISCSKETRDLLVDCCVEFIHLVSSEANELCEKENKKTISPEHIEEALKILGFSSYVTQVHQALEEHNQNLQQERARKNSKRDTASIPEEELLRQQQELFEQARKKYNAQSASESSITSNQ